MEYTEKATLLDEHAKLALEECRDHSWILRASVTAPSFYDSSLAARKHTDVEPFVIYETEVLKWLNDRAPGIGDLSVRSPGGRHLRNDLQRHTSTEFLFTLKPTPGTSPAKVLEASKLHVAISPLMSAPRPARNLPPAPQTDIAPQSPRHSPKKRRTRKAKIKTEN